MQVLKIINWLKLNIVALHLIVCAKRLLKIEIYYYKI